MDSFENEKQQVKFNYVESEENIIKLPQNTNHITKDRRSTKLNASSK
jgi:hypothetical protein